MKITPSLLFSYLQCPHRPWREIYGPQQEKSEEQNPFLELLWENGVIHEGEVIKDFAQEYLDLSKGTTEERIYRTKEALSNKVKFIYQGIIQHGNMFGIPDLLLLDKDGYYQPIDIKSGSGLIGAEEETGEEGKLKKHYAVQLCLYSNVLILMGFAKERKGIILDGNKNLIEYKLDSPMGSRTSQTYWQFYEETKATVTDLIQDKIRNAPAMCGSCKLCAWQDSCQNWCTTNNDLTLIFNLGRKVRDILKNDANVSSIEGLLNLDLEPLIERKKNEQAFLLGVGENTLKTAKKRAEILSKNLPPVLYSKIYLPEVSIEIYLDIEDIESYTYLHGLYVRTEDGEEFKYFAAKEISPEAEKIAWSNLWEYLKSLPEGAFAVYYYSSHEKTVYRKLAKKYPDVISLEEVNEFFNNKNVIDLYQTVVKYTDWPLNSYSIKPIAKYCGFKWRNSEANGALSIKWWSDYLKTKDEKIFNDILEYNCDDTKATMKLKDKLVEMNNKMF